MNTIKIFFATDGSQASLQMDFSLYQGEYQNKLLNVYIPTSVLAPQFQDWYISESGVVSTTTYTALTAVKIGSLFTATSGKTAQSVPFYLRPVKIVTVNNVEYELFERLLPSAFTTYATNNLQLTINAVNIANIPKYSIASGKAYYTTSALTTQAGTTTQEYDVVQDTENNYTISITSGSTSTTYYVKGTDITASTEQKVVSLITTQTCSLIVHKSDYLDGDEVDDPSELEVLNGLVAQNRNSINNLLPRMATAESDIDDLEDRMDLAESDIETLEDDVDALESSVGTIQITYLKKDGSVAMTDGYTPSGNQQIATKLYVDNVASNERTYEATQLALKVNKSDIVDNLTSSDTDKPLSANQGKILKATIDGVELGKVYTNIQAMITALNSATSSALKVPMSLWILDTDVPDFWVAGKNDTSSTYTYTSDEAFINAIKQSSSKYVQVGYYNVALAETKIDLTDYLKKDGSVSMDSTYTPSSDYQIATKKYVDSKAVTLTATIPSGAWTLDSTYNGYYKDVTVTGLLATDSPIIDIETEKDITNATNVENSWAKVYFAEVTSANTLRLWARADVNTYLGGRTLNVKVVR